MEHSRTGMDVFTSVQEGVCTPYMGSLREEREILRQERYCRFKICIKHLLESTNGVVKKNNNKEQLLKGTCLIKYTYQPAGEAEQIDIYSFLRKDSV